VEAARASAATHLHGPEWADGAAHVAGTGLV